MAEKNPVGVSRQTKRLNRQTGTSPMGGGCGVLFGLPFLVAGVCIVLVSADIIPSDDADFNVPRWVVGVVGGIFASAGLYLILLSLIGTIRKRRAENALKASPAQPWLADYRWNPEGIRGQGLGGSLKYFVQAFFIAAFLVPFHYVGWYADGGSIVFGLFASLFTLWPIGCVIYGFYCIGRSLKYGKSFLRFKTFPFFTGELLESELIPHGKIGGYTSFELNLRAIEEKIITRQTSDGTETSVAVFEKYRETQRFDSEGGDVASGASLPIVFDLPDNVFGTCLSQHPPRYWEIEVIAETPGIDYTASFLVPVYNRGGKGYDIQEEGTTDEPDETFEET